MHMMKSTISRLITLALVAAYTASAGPIETRQTRTTSNEFTEGGCRENIFIFSRGTSEAGNMGNIAGPPTSDGLKAALGANAVATEGVDYGAGVAGNLSPGGADPAGVRTMTQLVTSAAEQCPDSTLLVAGYSQGAAMVHRVMEDLDPAVVNQVAAVVTFGDTQNEQDDQQIPNVDAAKTKIICNPGDLVCNGTLTIRQAHLDYAKRAPEAVDFMVQKVQANGAQANRTAKLRRFI